MIIPMPCWMLDILLTVNIMVALTMLLVTVYTVQPLEFASFPSMLLVATLFRLALNIAATRQILINANAGAVISAFGSVVVGGNYVVGLVVFDPFGHHPVRRRHQRYRTSRRGRREVHPRRHARQADGDRRRPERRHHRRAGGAGSTRSVSREADFYGAMDGASKFVRGDAIAAVIMIVVNIIGGFLVGVAAAAHGVRQRAADVHAADGR